ncbi:MAG: 16S rRNA (uracil(1498)-N(3))-methyltransferase [Deinococcus sp.]|uniref:16S rRNA (uracil(1498)-N(3))-methyltransferase n=1 Tax=Deinococcus sp. TaxID=47478 RepID=UPI0026DBF172|nr:16S rRNA (uracil(1498)-N(3))-methyltransferase [Deinococcus sp.]MDO4245144.1 16S rRNA (uracil(1498)-N(3))-methyltransferase [Deinococcus sp.]
MRRLQVSEIAPEMRLGPQETRHVQVLRLRPGERLQVFDGRGAEAVAVLSELGAGHALLHLDTAAEAHSRGAEYPQPVTLAIALLKGDKLADVVRAATELGVSNIQLLVTQHAEARDIGAQKLVRLRRIASEAARQSERRVVPDVLEPLPLAQLTWEGRALLAHPGSAARVNDLLDWQSPLTLLSGPEGGFSEAEVALLRERGAEAVTLGPRILRAETAPLALLGAIAATGV